MLLVLDLHLQQDGTIDRPPKLVPLFGSIDPVDSFPQAVMMKSLGQEVQSLMLHVIDVRELFCMPTYDAMSGCSMKQDASLDYVSVRLDGNMQARNTVLTAHAA